MKQITRIRKFYTKIILLITILLTITLAAVVLTQSHNQNKELPTNSYLMVISQTSHFNIHEKTLYLSHNYTFTENIYEPIVVTADNILIDGNGYTLQGPGNRTGTGFYLIDRSNVTIMNVTVKGWYFGFYLENCLDCNILGNNVTNNDYRGFHLYNSSYNNLTSNIANSCYIDGFYLFNSSYNIFTNNSAINNVNGFEMEYYSTNNIFIGNSVTNNGNGFHLSFGTENCIIKDNNATDNNFGFSLFASSYNNLTRNSAIRNHHYGFVLWYCTYNNISGNTIICKQGTDFYVDTNSSNNIIANNTIITLSLPPPYRLYFIPYLLSYYDQLNTRNFSIVQVVIILFIATLAGSGFAVYRWRIKPSLEAVKEFIPTPIKTRCSHCGSAVPENSNFCMFCGEAISGRCSVCNLEIISGDKVVKCPYCGALSHRVHLLEWIKVRGYCPNCKEKLSQLDFL